MKIPLVRLDACNLLNCHNVIWIWLGILDEPFNYQYTQNSRLRYKSVLENPREYHEWHIAYLICLMVLLLAVTGWVHKMKRDLGYTRYVMMGHAYQYYLIIRNGFYFVSASDNICWNFVEPDRLVVLIKLSTHEEYSWGEACCWLNSARVLIH